LKYIELQCRIFPAEPASDILVAQLAEIGFESFEETDTGLVAYIPEKNFNYDDVLNLEVINSGLFDIETEYQVLEEKNWNALWESQYDPVLIDNTIFVRAPFHKPHPQAKYDIIIEPKMSFGTAHHETTALVLKLMLKSNLSGKTVLDMGCGTGILTIMAAKKGATALTAIDNDQWAIDNTPKNLNHNNVEGVEVINGDASSIPEKTFDLIVANINRNVIINDMPVYLKHLKKEGTLIVSGFYEFETPLIRDIVEKYDRTIEEEISENQWTALRVR
jgi:ribosomal protein L11 methyltransferase